MLSGVSYDRVDDAGLHITLQDGTQQLLEVDHVVVCAGQESLRDLKVSTLHISMTTFWPLAHTAAYLQCHHTSRLTEEAQMCGLMS